MITYNEQEFGRAIQAYNGALRGMIAALGADAPKMVKRQAGLLDRTLINITPPTHPAQTKQKIETNISRKFAQVDAPKREFAGARGGKHGSGDVDWYAWTSSALYGIAKESDMRDASVEALKELSFKVKRGGIIDAGQRGKQRVRIWKKIVTKSATVKKLVAYFSSHVGRLKAGWAVSWVHLGRPGRPIPKWVEEKIPTSESGGYGFYVDGLGTPGNPTFAIGNRAKGVAELKKKSGALLDAALAIRIKAMAKDVQFGIHNPGKYAQREADALAKESASL